MAIYIDTVQVTKVSVVEKFPKCYDVTLNLICEYSSAEVINEDFTVIKDDSDTFETLKDKFLVVMKEYIDKFNKEQTRFNHPQMDVLVTDIDTELENTYIP